MRKRVVCFGAVMFCGIFFLGHVFGGCSSADSIVKFPMQILDYQALEAGKNLSLLEILKHRVAVSPFNLTATILFFCAIIHTFFAPKFARLARKLSDSDEKISPWKHFWATICHFCGEVEVIFGIWILPLLPCAAFHFGWQAMVHYFNDVVRFAEPIFVVIIMAIAATLPVLSLAENVLKKIAGVGKNTVAAWWMVILMVTPFVGSFITEPAAMTIGAMLLAKQFYALRPSARLRYATLGLLFVNISVGGTLTHFAAPPILMVAHKWHITIGRIFTMLGGRAIIGVIVSTLFYYSIFRKEFAALQLKNAAAPKHGNETKKIPTIVTAISCLFLAWTVVNLHSPPLAVGGFLFFLAFVKATKQYQNEVKLKSPVLVGFFLAGLVIHGGLQEWWISPLLGSLKEVHLFLGSTILTSFNDNAAIAYLSSLVSEFATNPSLQKAVLAGAVTGGGLTVIANAPNPAGQNILSKYFDGGVSPLYLFYGAAIPTVIMAMCFNC